MKDIQVDVKKTVALIICFAILTSAITYVVSEYVRAQTPTTSFYLSGGIYPAAPDYTIFREGSNYYAKNENGQIEFYGTNATTVINDAISGLPTGTVQLPNPAGSPRTVPYGTLLFKAGQYSLSAPIQIALGSRIMIYGEGTSQQMQGNGGTLGTIIANTANTSVFQALSTSGAVTSAGTELVMKHIEFIQSVELYDAETKTVDLNGMSQGIIENVQVHKGYGSQSMRQGIGIECVNNIGGDHVGGYILWKQVQVYGFATGINCSINHWKAIQLGLANCTTALNIYNNLATRLEDVHVFNCSRILALYGGFTTYAHTVINGLYLEECGGGVGGYEWFVDSGMHGYLRIYNTNVNVVAGAGTLWRCNDNETLWFEDVMVTGGAPAFPSVTTPGTVQNNTYVNENMQLIEVWANWGTSNGVYINNDLITTANSDSGTFYLRPGDYISIDSASYTWHWRPYSADRGRQDDV